jgi:hypothetical protein
MHDLLYLSESKMQALVPQLPGQLRRRLGIEAGVNVWFASIRATLPGNTQQASLAVLDAVVQMIERSRVIRPRTEPGLIVGDWIRFGEEFRFGDAYLGDELTDDASASGLVYFVAAELPPFVLCGSAVHVLDRRQPTDQATSRQVGAFYVDAVRAYARKVAELADEAAISDPYPPGTRLRRRDGLSTGINVLHHDAANGPGWSDPVRLTG